MKALCKLEAKVDGNKITITGELVDVAIPAMVAQRHNTIHHPVNGHPSKPRHLQSNSLGFIVTRKGSDGVLFPKDEMVALACEIDSKLSDIPVFGVHPNCECLAGKVISELPVIGKIESSDDGNTWTEVVGADDKFKGEAGKFYRCVATNKNGFAFSNPVQIPKTPLK